MRILTALFLLLTCAAPAAAKTYSAERFDSSIRIRADGAIEVVETVAFHFESGSFTYVWREIPTRRTDGIEILSAEMDGRVFPFGKGSGQVEVRQGAKVRVRWRFAPRSGTTHTFVLRYIARGVVEKTAAGDRFAWAALPREHKYRIDSSNIVIEAPAAFVGQPHAETRRVEQLTIEPGGQRVQIMAAGIRRDGRIEARLDFPDGALIAAAPGWQQARSFAESQAPRWATAAGAVFAVAIILLIGLRQRYDSPRREPAAGSNHHHTPPDGLRPAPAGALAANGSVSHTHSLAALFAMADRGVVTISEGPRKWGQRQFSVERTRRAATLAPEELAVLDAAFTGKAGQETTVPFSTVQSRLNKHAKGFAELVRQELESHGLFDRDRRRVRQQFLGVSWALFALALLLVVPCAFAASTYQGWPFLIPCAVMLAALAGFIFYGAMTPLSNEGVRRAEAWRAYQRHLKEVAADRAVPASSAGALLPFALALGLGGAWAKYVKQHPHDVPGWFQAMSSAHDDGAFAAFMGSNVVSQGHYGGAGAAGGAAGGGGSGAG